MQRPSESLPNRRRRAALICAGLVAAYLPGPALAQAPAPAPAPVQQVIDFDVNLDRRPIGTHRFIVSRQAGATRIQSNARFDVRFLGLSAYRYRHQATEQWQGDCLTAIDATTHDNGRDLHVSGRQRDAVFQLQQPAAATLPACLAAYAYWNRDLLLRQHALLNPQTGKLDALRMESLGRQTLEVNGQAIAAERYRLHAAQNVIELWYSPQGDWLRLESTTGSRRLIYRLRATP